jgi:hypothetical protein
MEVVERKVKLSLQNLFAKVAKAFQFIFAQNIDKKWDVPSLENKIKTINRMKNKKNN